MPKKDGYKKNVVSRVQLIRIVPEIAGFLTWSNDNFFSSNYNQFREYVETINSNHIILSNKVSNLKKNNNREIVIKLTNVLTTILADIIFCKELYL